MGLALIASHGRSGAFRFRSRRFRHTRRMSFASQSRTITGRAAYSTYSIALRTRLWLAGLSLFPLADNLIGCVVLRLDGVSPDLLARMRGGDVPAGRHGTPRPA